jgi:DnaK suppressor protein
MHRTDVEKYRATLKEKHHEPTTVLGKREAIAVENVADTMDGGQEATERELAVRTLDRDSAVLRDVKVALARLEGGSYGFCLRCDEQVSAKRLDAVP